MQNGMGGGSDSMLKCVCNYGPISVNSVLCLRTKGMKNRLCNNLKKHLFDSQKVYSRRYDRQNVSILEFIVSSDI